MKSRPRLVVVFHKVEKRDTHSWWEARRPRGGRISGGAAPLGRGVIPHDLVHLATEARLGLEYGFWGCLERGATFRRGTDRRRTKPGRAIVRDHRQELTVAEALGGQHHHAWIHGQTTPMADTFDQLARLWTPLPHGGSLTVDWPTLDATASARGASLAIR